MTVVIESQELTEVGFIPDPHLLTSQEFMEVGWINDMHVLVSQELMEVAYEFPSPGQIYLNGVSFE